MSQITFEPELQIGDRLYTVYRDNNGVLSCSILKTIVEIKVSASIKQADDGTPIIDRKIWYKDDYSRYNEFHTVSHYFKSREEAEDYIKERNKGKCSYCGYKKGAK